MIVVFIHFRDSEMDVIKFRAKCLSIRVICRNVFDNMNAHDINNKSCDICDRNRPMRSHPQCIYIASQLVLRPQQWSRHPQRLADFAIRHAIAVKKRFISSLASHLASQQWSTGFILNMKRFFCYHNSRKPSICVRNDCLNRETQSVM